MNTIPLKKARELKRLEDEVALVQRKIDLLHLIDQKEKEIESEANVAATQDPPHQELFPVGTPVKFTNPNEKRSLRGKTGIVIGHSPKFVRVKKGEEKVLRLAKNLCHYDSPKAKGK